MKLELISPAKAQQFLDNSNWKNRSLNKNNVARLTKMIQDGHFHGELAEPIALTKDGDLVNGQHRLRAVIDSGKTVKMIVVRDADPNAFRYLDNVVKPRTNADILKLAGYQNYAEKAAAMRIVDVYRMRNGQIGTSSQLVGYEAIDMVNDYGDSTLDILCSSAKNMYVQAGLKVSTTLAGLVIGFESDKTNADRLKEWTDGITKGKGLYPNGNDPRSYLLRWSLGTKGVTSNQTSFIESFYMYTSCWNRWIRGAEMKKMPSISRSKKMDKILPVTDYMESEFRST